MLGKCHKARIEYEIGVLTSRYNEYDGIIVKLFHVDTIELKHDTAKTSHASRHKVL